MQRLFSIFPQGLPGCGLALLRIGVAAAVVQQTADLDTPLRVAALLPVAALMAGLLTPWFAALGVALALLQAALGAFAPLPAAIAVFHAAALGLLGPGAYSLDARLFGRRRLTFPRP
ncbi:hypothetical protein [Tahibacter caeni]|uniref:hypothetical protein n=1 Tax=Tahibacter caeni TaxID=1453545 RepID=UPI002147DFB8|nr:hypothetical protein [Tahibacter caeni]